MAADTGMPNNTADALGRIVRDFGADTGTLHLVGDDGLLHLKEVCGQFPPPVLDVIRTIPVGKGMAGLAVERGQPVDAEGDAGGVRGLQVGAGKTPGRSEVIAMIVEAHAGGRRFRRSDRHEHFEFQRLRDLEPPDHRAAAAEERIARGLDAVGEAERAGDFGRARDPLLAEIHDMLRWADRDEFAHAEGLQPIDIARGLAT